MSKDRPKKKINARDLVEKIELLTRKRIMAEEVVSIQTLKSLKGTAVPTILVVEDDESMRRALRRIFESEGYKVIMAQDATELSEVFDDNSTSIQLILMDVGLPWVNGFELAEMMKEHKDIKKIPIVFLSGHADQEMIRRGFSVGADDYITKPFELETVKRTIRTLLELQN
jgi:two-component system aerobic respiration control protein ArcA